MKTLRAMLRLTPHGPAERNSASGGLRQGGDVHAVLDREFPGPPYPLLKKRLRRKACDALSERIDVPGDARSKTHGTRSTSVAVQGMTH
eukprot:337690-Amphidinium_carterae.1